MSNVDACLELLDKILIGKDDYGTDRVALYELPTKLRRIQKLLQEVRADMEKDCTCIRTPNGGDLVPDSTCPIHGEERKKRPAAV